MERFVGDIDPEHRLKAQAPGHLPVGPVRVRVLVPEEDVPDLNGRAVSLANRQMNWRMLAKTSTGLIMDNKCNCHTVGSHPLENSWNQQSMVHCRPNGKRPFAECGSVSDPWHSTRRSSFQPPDWNPKAEETF